MRQERLDVRPAHLLGMAFTVMEDEATDPVNIRLLRSISVMFGSKGEPQAVEQSNAARSVAR